MNITVIISAFTAFIITAGGSMGIALVAAGDKPLNNYTWIMAVVLGLVSAAKDVRSLLKLPPVANGNGDSTPRTDGPGAAGKSILPLLLCLGLAAFIWGGCSSTQRTAYQAVGTSRVAATVAVNEWNLYVSQKHPPHAQQVAVKNAFDKWKASMLVLCDAGAAYSAAVQTNAPLANQLWAAVEQATSNAAQEYQDLTGLIQTFGVTLPAGSSPGTNFSPLPLTLPAKP